MTLSPTRRNTRLGVALGVAGLALSPWVAPRVLLSDGRIDDVTMFAGVLFVSLAMMLLGLQWICGWVERLAFGRHVGWVRVVTFVTVGAALAAGTWLRVTTFLAAHNHTHVVGSAQPVTAEQQQWADRFYQRALAAALKHGWFDFNTAMADGFQVDRVNRTHYPNLKNMFDGVVLDPERPEWLIYNDLPGGGKILMGYMFFTNKLEDVGPTPAGVLAQWHYHPYEEPRCAVNGLWTVSKPDTRGRCAEGIPVTRTPEMFHVWFVDHPLGRFSDMNLVPEYWEDDKFDLGTLHPISVHFAIGLFVIAVLIDLAALALRKPEYHRIAWANLALASIAAIAAVTVGMSAEIALRPTPEAHQTLDLHKQLAFASLAGILVLWAWRYALRGDFPRHGMAAVLYVVLSVAGLGAITGAGYNGGELVYRHGAGVSALDRFLRDRYWTQVREVYNRPAAGDVQNANITIPSAHHNH